MTKKNIKKKAPYWLSTLSAFSMLSMWFVAYLLAWNIEDFLPRVISLGATMMLIWTFAVITIEGIKKMIKNGIHSKPK